MDVSNYTVDTSIFDEALNTIASATGSTTSTESTDSSDSALSFADVLTSALDSVNEQAISADEITEEYAAGGDVEVHDVMLATEEANLSLEMAVQVRNKIVDAIDELTSLQI